MYTKIYDKGNNTYQLHYYNPRTKGVFWKTSKNLKELLELANKYDVDYHTEHPNELPKGVTLDKSENRFRFHVWLSGAKQKHIISSRSLEKVIKNRNYMLTMILDLNK